MPTNPNVRRIIKLQSEIHKNIRAEVRKAIGPQSKDLLRYYEAYKREFRVPMRHSSKEELIRECARSNIIMLGDYHTFAQSQKAALRLMRELVNLESPLALALEMVPISCQAALNQYMSGQIDDGAFLKAVDYQASWGFRWQNFKPLLSFAKEHNIPVVGLNHESKKLATRDAHAAATIAAIAAADPKRKTFVLYGDLHMARGHLPKALAAALKKQKLSRRVLTVFQNSELLYWKLAKQKAAHSIDVVRLGRDRFCIMNAAPWVKLQSYLEWAEVAAPLESPLESDDDGGMNLHEIAHDRLQNLTKALNLTLPATVDFTIQTVNDLGFLDGLSSQHQLKKSEAQAVRCQVMGNRIVFIPHSQLLYLSSASTNAINEGVTAIAHAALSGSRVIFHDPREHFYALAVSAAIAYFGSKVLNHKRKCDLEDDFKLLLESPLGAKPLPAERLQRKVASQVLKHLAAEREYLRSKRFRMPVAAGGPSRIALFLETTRALGAILGEKLYASYIEGTYPAEKIARLFKVELSDARVARLVYLALVGDLERAPLSHTSKADLL